MTDEALRLQREAIVLIQELGDVQGISEITLDIADLALIRGDNATAGTLVGAISSLAESGDFAFTPSETVWLDGTHNAVRDRLGPDELGRALEQGHGMTLDELVSYAIHFIDSNV